MPSNPNKPPVPPSPTETNSPTRRRLVAATMLIGLAIGGLALVDRLRERPLRLTPPHEPSQTLITSPAPQSDVTSVNPELPATPPPPPQVVNNETLPPPLDAVGVTAQAPSAEKTASVPGKAYMIQLGMFTSPANAQALQKQLQRAGLEAHLETRVHLGPFKDKRDADKALARARKLGINAVLVSAR